MSESVQSEEIILANEDHDWSLGSGQIRKSRFKPVRSGFNCLGFIPVHVLNQRKNCTGFRRGARQGLQTVRELTCRICCKYRFVFLVNSLISNNLDSRNNTTLIFVAHKRAGLKIHIRENHGNEEILMNSSQRHCQQRFNTFDIKKHSSVEEIRSEVMVELGESLTKEMIAAIMLRQSFQPEVLLSGNLNKVLRETLTTETDASLGRRNDADWLKRDENKDDCVATTSHDFATVVSQSHIDRDLKNNQPLGIYEFMEDVERALNMQTVNHEETPRTRKVPMSESEKVDLKGRLQRGGKQGRKLFEHTGGKSKCRKESQIVTCIQLPQPKLVKEKRTRKLTRDWGQRRGILSRKRLNFEEFEKEVARGEYKRNSQDVEVVHLECHDDEVFKEETDESKTGNRIKFNQSGNDDPEILTEEVTITTNKENENKDINLKEDFLEPSKSPCIREVITLDEDGAIEQEQMKVVIGNVSTHGMVSENCVELEEINLCSPLPVNDKDSSAISTEGNNDSKEFAGVNWHPPSSKSSFGASQLSRNNNEHPFKKLKMSEPMTLEENEDVIELD